MALLAALLPAPAQGRPAITQYTAFGDSIAFGVGATGFYGYGYRFRDHLQTSSSGLVTLSNRSVPGITSTSLLNQLPQDGSTRLAVRQAEVLTISIGGNHLLGCASSNYTVLDTDCAARGVATFQHDWPQILAEIRTRIRPKAKLYGMTIYNAYRGDEPYYSIADPYVRQINATIQNTDYLATYGYKSADTYADFQGQFADGTWKVCRWTRFCEATRDPHPTDSGHLEIARLHEVIYP